MKLAIALFLLASTAGAQQKQVSPYLDPMQTGYLMWKPGACDSTFAYNPKSKHCEIRITFFAGFDVTCTQTEVHEVVCGYDPIQPEDHDPDLMLDDTYCLADSFGGELCKSPGLRIEVARTPNTGFNFVPAEDK